MPDMEETTIVGPEAVREGFAGQRMLVLAPPVRPRRARPPGHPSPAGHRRGVLPARRPARQDASGRGRAARRAGVHRRCGLVPHARGTVPRPARGRRGAPRVRRARVRRVRGRPLDPLVVPRGRAGRRASSSRPRTGLPADPVAHLRDPAGVASLVAQVIDALDTGTAGGLVTASGAAWHALAQLVATGRRVPGPSPSPVERAVEHLRATTPRRTSVDALAAMVGLSPSQLGSLFRRAGGRRTAALPERPAHGPGPRAPRQHGAAGGRRRLALRLRRRALLLAAVHPDPRPVPTAYRSRAA